MIGAHMSAVIHCSMHAFVAALVCCMPTSATAEMWKMTTSPNQRSAVICGYGGGILGAIWSFDLIGDRLLVSNSNNTQFEASVAPDGSVDARYTSAGNNRWRLVGNARSRKFIASYERNGCFFDLVE